MYTEMPFIKRKLRGLAWKIFNTIENNGNADFEQNGEKPFVDNLLNSLKLTVKEGQVVFDIGANIGDYSTMLLEKAKKIDLPLEVHLFEPTHSCFNIIKEKFRNQSNMTLNNFGISNFDEHATIYYDKEQSGLASLYQRNLDSYNLKMNQSEEIVLKRVDKYIEQKNIQHIDFIKIDIEGHELKAFEGFGKYLNADFIDYIQFEYGGANLDSHTSLMEIYKFFEDRNFKIAKMMPNGLEIRSYQPYMENFNYSNFVAISSKILNK
ncbi:FkbM family methyltransferase [Sulfurovum sp.]|uniref:FkbM family methyltransferase n=1 Tax=Sulfurovum sp. TaxID=1969726 RepID=UPI00356AFBD3